MEGGSRAYYLLYFVPLASDAVLYLLSTCAQRFSMEQREFALRCSLPEGRGWYPSRHRIYRTLKELQHDILNPPGTSLLCIDFGPIFPSLHLTDIQQAKPREFERTFPIRRDGNACGMGEMIIDVDMDPKLYNRQGVCGCGQAKQVCDACWFAFIEPAQRTLEWAMCDYFGFKRVFCVFSGRRGFHMWICDPRVVEMTQVERLSIARRLVMPSSDEDEDDFIDGMYEILKRTFDTHPVLRYRIQANQTHRSAVFASLWPKIDMPVTADATHLHKVPLVLHADTHAVCIVIGNPDDASDRFVPSLHTYVPHKTHADVLRGVIVKSAQRIIEKLRE